jgi:hypothetical protein
MRLKTSASLLLLLLTLSLLPAQAPPIRLLSTYVLDQSGQMEGHFIQWSADSGTVSQDVPTGYATFLAGSSFFDAFAGRYHFRASTDTSSQYLQCEVDSLSFAPMPNSDMLIAATEVDMQSGQIWGLTPINGNTYGLVEYRLADSSTTTVGLIPEVKTLFVDANCYDSNDGIFYFIALDDSLRYSLFAVSTAGPFSYTRLDLGGTGLPLATSLEYDNERDKIYALYTYQDSMSTTANARISEIDIQTGVVSLVLDMPQYRYYQMSSQTYDQTTASIVFIAIDAGLNYSLNIFSTVSNTLRQGTLPLNILPFNLECDNTSFARLKYGSVTATANPAPATTMRIYPVPAQTYLMVDTGREVSEVQVWDAMGRLVHADFAPDAQRLSVESLPAGGYLLRAIGPKGELLGSKRFVKD